MRKLDRVFEQDVVFADQMLFLKSMSQKMARLRQFKLDKTESSS
jgi:hypothetical protein